MTEKAMECNRLWAQCGFYSSAVGYIANLNGTKKSLEIGTKKSPR